MLQAVIRNFYRNKLSVVNNILQNLSSPIFVSSMRNFWVILEIDHALFYYNLTLLPKQIIFYLSNLKYVTALVGRMFQLVSPFPAEDE